MQRNRDFTMGTIAYWALHRFAKPRKYVDQLKHVGGCAILSLTKPVKFDQISNMRL